MFQLNKFVHILLMISIVGCNDNIVSKEPTNNPTNQINQQQSILPTEQIIYSPDKSLYKVSFPIKPDIVNGHPLDSKNLYDEIASVLLPSDNNCYLRAEFIIMNKTIIKEEDKIKIFKKFSFANGLSNVSISSIKTKVGNCIELRGYRIFKDTKGEIMSLTYTANYYFNKNTIFGLSAGSLSTVYPTSSITNFFNSIDYK